MNALAVVRPVVVHVNDPAGFDVYVGRRNNRRGLPESPFHNPFRVGKGAYTRDDAVRDFARFARSDDPRAVELRRQLPALARLIPEPPARLGCWCAPRYACHGYVLAEMVAGLDPATVAAWRVDHPPR